MAETWSLNFTGEWATNISKGMLAGAKQRAAQTPSTIRHGDAAQYPSEGCLLSIHPYISRHGAAVKYSDGVSAQSAL
jgi:hypothetical protein